jgi:predicted RNase H-like HicB family nuclease
MINLELTVEIWKKGKWYIARCPELDFVSQGVSVEDARRKLEEVTQIQFEEMHALGTLEDYLFECGYTFASGTFIPQSEMIGIEKSSFQVL